MKKTTRSILSLCLAVIMIAAMATTAFAAQTGFNTHSTVTADSDTGTITLKKVYELLGDLTYGQSPTEDFTVTITPHSFKNAPAGFIKANMPVIGEPEEGSESGTVTFKDSIVGGGNGKTDTQTGRFTHELTATIEIPDVEKFAEVGDFYYTVKENAGDNAGVTYDPSTYMLHVQIVKVGTTSVRLVTLHKTNNDSSNLSMIGSKTDHIQNEYSNGGLTIGKTVSGKGGELGKYFGVKVVFTAPTDKTVMNDITVTAAHGKVLGDSDTPAENPDETALSGMATFTKVAAGENGWDSTKSVIVYLKSGETATFTNIPYGVTYTVQELNYSDEEYLVPTYSLDTTPGSESKDTISGSTWSDKKAAGLISDLEDRVDILNQKDANIDVGVVLEDAPFVMLIVVSVAALGAFLVIRRKREI